MNSYINIHSHQLTAKANELLVSVLDSRREEPLPLHCFCWGIHPWYIPEFSIQDIEQKIKVVSQHEFFFALGEIGLDKACKVDFQLQIDYLKHQLDLAKKYHINLLVLHCVRSYQEIFKCLLQSNYKGAILFHDFRGNVNIFKQFDQKFKTYVSFNVDSLQNIKVSNALKSIPLQCIFFETDDSNLDIESAYKLACEHLNIPLEMLQKEIESNFNKLKTS